MTELVKSSQNACSRSFLTED